MAHGFRAEIVNRGAKPVIPNKSNRVTLHSFSKRAYKGRRGCYQALRFCRLKGLQACRNSLRQTCQKLLAAAVHLAAIVALLDQSQFNPRTVSYQPSLPLGGWEYGVLSSTIKRTSYPPI